MNANPNFRLPRAYARLLGCILFLAASCGCALCAQAQTIEAAPTIIPGPPTQAFRSGWRSYILPKDFVRGYIDAAIAPPHNEPDLGRCNSSGPQCTAFARYAFSGYVEFQPFARTPLKHLFAFYEPRLFCGDNIPQLSYTYSAQPLAIERILGVGLELPRISNCAS